MKRTSPARRLAPVPASAAAPSAAKARLEGLSEFRYQLRSFLRFSEDASRAEGITVLQYQLLLHVCGFPGREWATIGEIAERLQAHHHGAVALVSRAEELGLVRRRPHPDDRRQVQVHILPKGRRIVTRLAATHQGELGALYGAIRALQGDQGAMEMDKAA